MLKLLGFCLKITVFATIVLVLGNWIHWDGRTISDQVRLRMAHAERSGFVGAVRSWADKVTHDAQQGFKRKLEYTQDQEEIPSSERQKLKALIQELNSSPRTK